MTSSNSLVAAAVRTGLPCSRQQSVIVMTGHGTVESAVEAMRRGVADYVTKPVSWDEMLIVVRRELDRASLRRENSALRATLRTRHSFALPSAAELRTCPPDESNATPRTVDRCALARLTNSPPLEFQRRSLPSKFPVTR